MIKILVFSKEVIVAFCRVGLREKNGTWKFLIGKTGKSWHGWSTQLYFVPWKVSKWTVGFSQFGQMEERICRYRATYT